MRISDWSSDVCSSDLPYRRCAVYRNGQRSRGIERRPAVPRTLWRRGAPDRLRHAYRHGGRRDGLGRSHGGQARSEEHTSELQSLMRISYAVFCLKTKKMNNNKTAIIKTRT